MNNTLDLLFSDLSDQYEVTVRPFDARWEAVVTNYETKRTTREVGRTAKDALEKALFAAHKAPEGFEEEPDVCEECHSYATMTPNKVSMNGKDGIPAWICDDCGHAHLNPDHLEEDCMGC